jgi:hypothetical protein
MRTFVGKRGRSKLAFPNWTKGKRQATKAACQ